MKVIIIALLSLAWVSVGQAQLKTALSPAAATQLHPGELIRYFKVRPQDLTGGLPYQVLIVVTTDAYSVKTNQWEFTQKLNDAQKEDLQVSFGYQEAKDFRRPYLAPPPPADPTDQPAATGPNSRLDYYLAFRKKGQTITWNSRKYGQPQLPSLFDFLEVCHYLARKNHEPEKQ